MDWDREGQIIEAMYMGTHPISGFVTHSRVKYGGHVQHTVALDKSILIYGTVRTYALVDENELTNAPKMRPCRNFHGYEDENQPLHN